VNLDDLAGRLTISVPEAGRALNIGRDAAYAAAARGEIPTLRLGRTLRVSVPKLLQLLGVTEDIDPAPPDTRNGPADNGAESQNISRRAGLVMLSVPVATDDAQQARRGGA
jgi:excisionase family DNA binding protein